MLQLMQSTGGEGSGEGSGMEQGGVSVKVSTLSASYTSSEVSSSEGLTGDEQDAKEQLKAELRQIINNAISDDVVAGIATVMQIISYVIYFTFFTWAWLILKILVKCRRHCNGIKLKLPIWLGWLPYLILGILPNSIISTMKDPATIAQLGMGEIGSFMSAININFFNCGFISFYIAIFLLLFGLFYYGPLRRKLKKEAKRMKKEAKKAKKEAKKAAKLGYTIAADADDVEVENSAE
jgi:flagellar basal body-associated protein FliL